MRQRPGYLANQIAQDFEFRVKLLQPSLSPALVTQRLLDWTEGQPFLTYRLYELLLQGPLSSWAIPEEPLPHAAPIFDADAEWVDRYMECNLVKNCHDPELVRHLRGVCKNLIHDPRSVQMLKLYRRLLEGRNPKANLNNYVQLRLVQSGVAKVHGEHLVVSNRFYAEVFNRHWLRRAFHTVEARLRDEAVSAIESVFVNRRFMAEERPVAQPLHPELRDRALLLANARRGTDCLLLSRPENSYPPRPNPYRRNNRSALRMAMALVACAMGAVSILLIVNFNREAAGETPLLPPSVLQFRDSLRDLSR